MIRRLFDRIAWRFPLTVSGTIVVVVSGLLLSRAIASGNGAGVILALTALLAPFVLLVVNLLCATGYARLAAGTSWNLPAFLMAGKASTAHSLTVQQWRLPGLLSLHVDLRQLYRSGGQPAWTGRFRLRVAAAGSFPLPVVPPASGFARLELRLTVRDFFGFTRLALPDLAGGQVREVPVLPPAAATDFALPLSAAMASSSRFLRSGEEEKVLTRDYILGDPGRDIHWKAYARIAKLITRVSPESREETRRFCVNLRLCGPASLGGALILASDLARGLCSSLVASLLAQDGATEIDLRVQNRVLRIDCSTADTEWRNYIAEAVPRANLEAPLVPQGLSVISIVLSSDPLLPVLAATADPASNSFFLVRGAEPGEAGDGQSLLPGGGMRPTAALLRGGRLPTGAMASPGIQDFPFRSRWFP